MDITTFLMQTDSELLKDLVIEAKDAKVGDVVFCNSYYSLVLEIHHWPLNSPNRKKAPIKADHIAVEVITNNGTRWHGYLPN